MLRSTTNNRIVRTASTLMMLLAIGAATMNVHAPAAHANTIANNDLSVTVHCPTTMPVNAETPCTAEVTNYGPDDAWYVTVPISVTGRDASLHDTNRCVSANQAEVCTTKVRAGQTVAVPFSVVTSRSAFPGTPILVTASAASAGEESSPADNVAVTMSFIS